MKIIEGKVRFGRKILFLGKGDLRYREGDRIHELQSHGNAYLYYKGAYEIEEIGNIRQLILVSRKDITDAIRFLTAEKPLKGVHTIEVDELYIYHPELDKETRFTII